MNTTKLELENILSQIYSNDFVYDGPFTLLSFDKVSFITLNSIDIYTKQFDVCFGEDYLLFYIDYSTIEIKYSDIDFLFISLKEDYNVHK